MNIIKYLGQRSKFFLIVLGILLVILQGFINYLAGPAYSFTLLYLIPVSLVAWFVGRWAGILLSGASAIAWFITDLIVNHPYSSLFIPYWNVATRLCSFLVITFILSALKRSLDQERQLARTDYLTGMLNRRSFFEQADAEINRSRRHKRPFTVAYMDIDGFKKINDHLGHTVGDTLLHTIAETIKSNVRTIDITARLGGDEFIILMPETGHDEAQVVIRRVRKNLMDVAQKNNWPITFSIGMVTWTSPPRNVDLMIKVADDTMYSAKNTGKDMIKHHKIAGEPATAA